MKSSTLCAKKKKQKQNNKKNESAFSPSMLGHQENIEFCGAKPTTCNTRAQHYLSNSYTLL